MTKTIRSITVEEASAGGRPDEFAHEIRVAVNDLLHEHHFIAQGVSPTPYDIILKTEEQRIVFLITPEGSNHTTRIAFSVAPLKMLIRDYFIVCESYFDALKVGDTRKIEAVDMGRRGLHNEAAQELQAILKGKIDVDFCTARRLFTLITVLHL